jgi:hypothetical protein
MTNLLKNAKSEAVKTAPKELDKAAKTLGERSKSAVDERISIRIDAAKRETFKRACMRNMKSMSDEVEAFIDDYISRNPE